MQKAKKLVYNLGLLNDKKIKISNKLRQKACHLIKQHCHRALKFTLVTEISFDRFKTFLSIKNPSIILFQLN